VNFRTVAGISTSLGEGPYWDPVAGVLYFVDIRDRQILRYDPQRGSVEAWDTPIQPAAISRTVDGRLTAALGDGFYDFDPDLGTFELLSRVEFGSEEEALNDAKVDRQGRFVAGATNSQSGRPVAGVYSFDGEKVTRIIDSGFEICNGPCWSPDGKTFYLADTGPNVIYAYDYDTESGTVSNRRAFADISGFDGLPDGATVDAEGRVWWTFVRGDGSLVGFNPDGSVHQHVRTGIRWMTSIQFGGGGFDEVYLTSMHPERIGLGETVPNPGALFTGVLPGAIGLPEPLAASSPRTQSDNSQ
jgi:L-arabinonolactonase